MTSRDIRFPAQTQPFSGLSGAIYSLVAAVSAWNDERVTRRALSQLSNHELEDIGLMRGDIDRVSKNRF